MSVRDVAKGTALVVDDDASLCELLATGLGRRGWTVITETRPEAALERLRDGDVEVCVTDLRMRGLDGLALCERALGIRPDVPVLAMTAFGNLDIAIAAIRAGAYDFLTKPFEIDALDLALERALRHRRLAEEVRRLRLEAGTDAPEVLFGESDAMREVRSLVARVALVDATVLVTGESGSGKELVARALHALGPRREAPFVALNCGAMPEQLLESELFGHVRGAFTDARSARAGLFQQANRGMLFLDEIGDMPLGMQVKLLRALETRRVRPLGGDDEVPFDVRLVAATHRDLETEIEEGRFREDLYYRIHVIHVGLPPLRARGGDVLLLAQRFVTEIAARMGKHVAGISAPAAEKLLAYRWPGNVRELRNCIERAIALARLEQIVVGDLPEKVRDWKPSHVLVASEDPSELLPMEAVERRYVLRVLETVGGARTEAARILGFDRKTLYRKLVRWGVAKERE